MPLQNRIDPFGDLFASPARGTLLGNRGGKFHRDDKTLGHRRWASRQWICCKLCFKGRQRDVWGRFYTELFFLDEVTALAAGHRPCFECRRDDALPFATAFGAGRRASVSEMDYRLHVERLDGKRKRVHRLSIDALPDGTMIVGADAKARQAFAVRGARLLPWTPTGYGAPRRRPAAGTVDVLTPPSMIAALTRGYRPAWHPSAAPVRE